MKFKLFAMLILSLSSLSALALSSDNFCTPGASCGPCCGSDCCHPGSACCNDCCGK